MKKITSILLCFVLIFTLSGCTGKTYGLNIWQGLFLGGLVLLYACAYIVGIVGINEWSGLLTAIGYFMAILACGLTVVFHGILYGMWWIIIIAIILFVVFVAILKYVEDH